MKTSPLFVAIVLAAFVGTGLLISQSVTRNRQWRAFNAQSLQYRLSSAAWAGDMAEVKKCLDAGADVNAAPLAPDGHIAGRSALAASVETGHESVVRYLLNHGADPNGAAGDNPLLSICSQPSKSTLAIGKLLLEHGANPNVPEKLMGRTPLAVAKHSGLPDLASLLQQYGAHE